MGKVYLILDNYDGRIFLIFKDKEKAERYCIENTDYFMEEMEVI